MSRCAEREFRFVEPRSVRMGADFEEGDIQMPTGTQSTRNYVPKHEESTFGMIGPTKFVPF